MNKVYLFKACEDAEYGVFVAAKNWKDARNRVMGQLDYDDFIEISGNVMKMQGKYIYTEKEGKLGPHDLLELGVDWFWWDDAKCDKCGKYARVYPIEGKLVCSKCEEKL